MEKAATPSDINVSGALPDGNKLVITSERFHWLKLASAPLSTDSRSPASTRQCSA
jgi:hypothetical protein